MKRALGARCSGNGRRARRTPDGSDAGNRALASRRFVSVKELLQGAAVHVAHATGSTAAMAPYWNEAVGPAVSKNAQPFALYGGTLVVRVTSAQWVTALEPRSRDIL